MKGVSQIVLALLILMIAMTAITILWLNFYGVFQKITSSGNTSALGEALSTCMKIDSVSSNKIYLRNCGSGVITNSSLRVYFDETFVDFSMSPQTIGKEGTGIITLYGLWWADIGNHKLKITTPSAEIERFVKTVYSSHLFSDEILYLNFDEGSGNKTYDLSPYHNDGFINASGRNQIKNPSFEMDKQDWGVGEGNWNIVTDEKYHGNKSSRFQSLTADGSSQCTDSIYIPVVQDEKIIISLYSKGQNIVQGATSNTWDNAYVFGRWINSTGGDACWNRYNPACGCDSNGNCNWDPYYPTVDLQLGNKNGIGTWEWERNSSEAFQVPPGAVYYRFVICLGWNATGTLWVDAVQVEYDDKATDFRPSPWVSENSYDYVCSSANEYDDITVSCPDGKVIDSIENSVYTDENSPASCSYPTPAGFCPATSCPYPCNCNYPYIYCIGKNSCSFNVNNGNCPPDPCSGIIKKLILEIKCKNWAESKFGNALEFDGVDDYVDVSNVPVNTSDEAYNTVSFWMYWKGGYNGGWSMPFSWSPWHYDINFNSNGYFGFNTYNSDVWGMSSSGLSNRWVFVAAIFYNGDGKKSRLFIDGVEQTLSQKQGTTGSSSVSNSVRIGSGSDSTNYFFDGIIDDLRIWNRSLSQDEIRSTTPLVLTLGELD